MKVFKENDNGTIEQIGIGKYYYEDDVGDLFVTNELEE